MSNELATIQNEMGHWEDESKLKEIKAIFAPKLSDNEFKFFVGMGKANDLNPFTREIWAIKYAENTPAQIFIGRDGYRKSAQRNPDYSHHVVESVYENDEFKFKNGAIDHAYSASKRGKLIAAYCLVYKKSIDKPIYVYCELSEYSTGKSLWHSETGKQATMIKKVAEAQCLRMAFQEQYSGSYSEYEQPMIIDGQWKQIQTQSEKMHSLLTKKGLNNAQASINAETVCDVSNSVTVIPSDAIVSTHYDTQGTTAQTTTHSVLAQDGESKNSLDDKENAHSPCTQEQLESISFLNHEKSVDKAGQLKFLDHFGVSEFNQLTEKQANAVIKKLNSLE